MLNVDVYKRSTPRVELDQRARDARLGLERIERLLGRRAGPVMRDQAKASGWSCELQSVSSGAGSPS